MESKKSSGRKYTRKELEEIRTWDAAQGKSKIFRDLVQRAADGSPMSLAEKDHAYRIIRASFKAATGGGLDVGKFPALLMNERNQS